jgi:hypothetical protein
LYYCIPPLGDVIDVFDNVRVIERVNVNPRSYVGLEESRKDYYIMYLTCRPSQLGEVGSVGEKVTPTEEYK